MRLSCAQGQLHHALKDGACESSTNARRSGGIARVPDEQQHEGSHSETVEFPLVAPTMQSLEDREQGNAYSASTYQQVDAATTRPLRCFGVVLQQPAPLEPATTFKAKQPCRGNTLGRLGTEQQGAAICQRRPERSHVFRDSSSQAAPHSSTNGSSQMQPCRYGYWPTALEARPAARAPAIGAALPAAKAVTFGAAATAERSANATFLRGSCSRAENPAAVRRSLAARWGGPHNAENAHSCAPRVAPHHWSPTVFTNKDAASAFSRTGELIVAAVGADISTGHATGLHLARASSQLSTRTPGTTAAAVGTATVSQLANGKPFVTCSESMVTRRQSAAAQLTEVVRIDDSSDEDTASPSLLDRAHAAPVTPALTMNEGPGLAGRDRLALEDFVECGEKPQSSQPPTAYVVFVAALVKGDGRCCLLSADTVLKAAEQSGDLGRQQESTRSGEAGVAAAVPEAERVKSEFKAEDQLLVLQAHQSERGISLDLWKPRLLRGTPDLQLSSDHAGISVAPAAPTHDEELSNILSFSTKSLCHTRCLNLCTEYPDSVHSRSSISKEICRRCGRGKNRSKLQTSKEETPGRDSKHRTASVVDKERKDSATVEVSVKTSRHTDGKVHLSKKGQSSIASSGGQSVTVVQPTAPKVASDELIIRESSVPKAKKSRTKRAHECRASAPSGSSHELRSEGRKEVAEPRVTSDGQPRHGRSHSIKSCRSHDSSKGTHTRRSGGGHSKPKSTSTRTKRRIEEAPSSGASDATSDQQAQKNAAPINVLAVYSGKPPRENPQLKPDPPEKAEASSHSNGEDSTGCRETGNGADVNSRTMHPASSVEGPLAESQESTHEGQPHSSGRKESKEKSPREQSTTGSNSRTHRSGEKVACCSSNHISRSCSLRSDRAYSNAIPAVPVLCLELQQSEVGGLQCSKLVQSMLKLDCEKSPAGALFTQHQQVREMSQSSELKPSRVSTPSHLSSLLSDMTEQVCWGKANKIEDNSKGSKEPHRSRRRSRDPEHIHGPVHWRCSRSKSSSQRTHSKKHHRSDDARKQPKSDGISSRKKRGRETTPATVSDGHGKIVGSKCETTLDSQRQCRSGSADSSCKRVPTSASGSAFSNKRVPEKSGGAVLPRCGKEDSERALCEGAIVEGQQNAPDYLHGDFCASGSEEGFLLMLCVGPLLHDLGVARDTTTGSEGNNELDPSSPPLGCTLHPVSKFASVECSGSSASNGRQEKLATANPTCSSENLVSLCTALTGPLGGRGRLLGKPEELVDVVTLAKCIAYLTAKQRGKALLTRPSAQSSHQTNESLVYLTSVLERLVRGGHELGERIRSSGSLNCNLPLEGLLRAWESRALSSPKFAVAGAAAVQKPAGPCSPVSFGPAAVPSSKEENATAAAVRAAASPPVFDLLLDDKTLRRLSGKEFLDDTIIDFCLAFIVDHILTPEERLRVHISNTFFLSALMAQICEVEGHSRLTRWLKKELTPLPRKDFIFIPVHHKDQHWSLAVVVYPWRALNCTTDKVDSLRRSTKMQRSEQAASESRLDSLVLKSPSAADCGEPDARKLLCCAMPAAKRRGGSEAGNANVSGSLLCRGPHAHRGSRPRARMFHVDSMGLRSVFDRCRGRLKRFLRREFEYRCGGTLKSGESAELCTESCCWQDGQSCALHTPRQQNGYDCGVFVVEYVHFLTRNLNAIELLLSGPTRDHQPYEHGFSPLPSPSGSCIRYPAPPWQSGKSEGQSEDGGHSGRLETLLGFSCPCMAVGKAVDPTAEHTYTSSLVEGTRFSNVDSVSVGQREQQQYLQPKPCLSTNALPQHGSVNLQKLEPVHPSLMPYATTYLEEKQAKAEPALQSCSMSTRWQLHGAKTPSEAPLSEAAVAASTKMEPTRHSTCPPWGPLPYSFSKRRSAHTKWFSQDRVTQRRSQLLKMLVFMRQNALWREDPKLIAHLKSLFLGAEGS
ncbi:hypothetical protein Esti_000352 [Eimeria stiedai]